MEPGWSWRAESKARQRSWFCSTRVRLSHPLPRCSAYAHGHGESSTSIGDGGVMDDRRHNAWSQGAGMSSAAKGHACNKIIKVSASSKQRIKTNKVSGSHGTWAGECESESVKDQPGEGPIGRFFATKLSESEACEMPAMPISPRTPKMSRGVADCAHAVKGKTRLACLT
ncbi:hypothetical protein COCVIDRAFT_18976 [Bipolaris victoriae FI3]|uniref:Uncharacterized protein n=1 Tax=Bipolaris victoriae (strain FI3) TaxID=930091 RepID=W7EC11_BIPV3|nr:hypothetical protein COCVIDRAFT_18976 [Bipolaris victoriae FI3]